MSISKNLLRSAFVLALAVAGCDDDEPLNTPDAARDATVDVPRDMAPQVDTRDTAADVGDTGGDGRTDTSTDLRPDAATDLRLDTGDALPNLDVADGGADAADGGADAADGGDASAGG
ncbi:MAG TPA: hypothetical protein VGG33_16745 [Polyangia bacterium]